MRCAWRVVSFTYQSRDTMRSRRRHRQPRAVRRGPERVPRHRDERAHLPLARRLDLLGERHHRASRRRSRRAPHTRLCQRPKRAPAAAGLVRRDGARPGGLREHRAARTVEVAGQHVEQVERPGRERPEALHARPDAPVGGGRRRRDISRASRRITCAAIPQRSATRSGAKSRGDRLDLGERRSRDRRDAPSATRPSANSTWIIASRNARRRPAR